MVCIFGESFLLINHKSIFQIVCWTYGFERSDKGRIFSHTSFVDLYKTVFSEYSFVFLLQILDEIGDSFTLNMQQKQPENGSNRFSDENNANSKKLQK